MKQYLQYFLFAFTLLCIAEGCKKDDAVIQNPTDTRILQTDISGVNGPISGKVNQELIFNLAWYSADTTRKFDHLKDSTFHNITTIKLFSSSKGGDSTLIDKATNSILYKFKATTAGTYYLKFLKPDNSDKTAIIDTIHIK